MPGRARRRPRRRSLRRRAAPRPVAPDRTAARRPRGRKPRAAASPRPAALGQRPGRRNVAAGRHEADIGPVRRADGLVRDQHQPLARVDRCGRAEGRQRKPGTAFERAGIEPAAPGADVARLIGHDGASLGRCRRIDRQAIRRGMPAHVAEQRRHARLAHRRRSGLERQAQVDVVAGPCPDLPGCPRQQIEPHGQQAGWGNTRRRAARRATAVRHWRRSPRCCCRACAGPRQYGRAPRLVPRPVRPQPTRRA